MQKPTLAEQVLQKMKEKRDLQQKNKPHYEVLRLEAVFSRELNTQLKEEIKRLEELLVKQQNTLGKLEEYTQELDSTGKKELPRIIIRPDFLASSKVGSTMKQFWLKSSNTFLRTDILRKRNFQSSCHNQQLFLQQQQRLKQLQQELWSQRWEQRRTENFKRTKVLKEDIRLRELQHEVASLRQSIADEREERIELLRQYELKAVNAENRKAKLAETERKIQWYRQKIQQTYNPVTYREHLKQVFALQTKNQMLARNIDQVRQRVRTVQMETDKFQKPLEKHNLLSKLGKFHSPGVNKRRNNSSKPQSERSFHKAPKITPWKRGVSVYLTDDQTLQLSKQHPKVSIGRELNVFEERSPKHCNKQALLTNFPRYRSAFQGKIK